MYLEMILVATQSYATYEYRDICICAYIYIHVHVYVNRSEATSRRLDRGFVFGALTQARAAGTCVRWTRKCPFAQ